MARCPRGTPRLFHRRPGFVRACPHLCGEPLIRWGGTVFTQGELEAGKAEGTVAIDEHLYLGDPAGAWDRERNDVGDFINHSCDGNLWMADEVTLAARRAIVADEELTIDYALFKGDDTSVARFVCHCGSPHCRTRVTGRDWRLPELHERYSGHFSPFLNRRIAHRVAQEDTHR